MILSIVFSSEIMIPPNLINIAYAQRKPIPPYAKWGVLAMNKTKEKYPNAQIIDYLHIGRTSGPATTTEKFKLWLKENGKEFGVFIDIEFNNKTEQVMKVTFKETSK
ncbi:YqzG/YhdC family protein [Bacillus xiapuensis]|uniref:YqzG/YhdC family protein n=2 Tax=Bacillaceae TaxID=186817 RepID=A0ABU6N532_9BACI|nr:MULTISPECIES: YqzG/YhdC family protein [Bacillus]MED3561331.1 YqzG/YhdC family protein [Bacillus xiapuensis]